ncbi:MAG: helix-turn-helix domain-containing protein [Acidimicrobiia bacterium]|nr:helix-turn-helix domain-containing protein [Acidimicrobiia bacterium]
MSIGELVGKEISARVVAFDPETFDVGYHEITGFYEGPEDRIYEVELSSGRRVRVTAGHNLFTLDRAGQLAKIRTGELVAGARVAVPRNVPGPDSDARSPIRVVDLVPEGMIGELSVEGPTVASAFAGAAGAVNSMLRASGYKHTDHYRRSSRLPLSLVRQVPGLETSLTPEDRLVVRGGRNSLSTVVRPTEEFAWLLGIYVAEGSRRRHQFTVSNTDQAILDRVETSLEELGLPISRSAGAITCCSSVASEFLTWIGAGGHAPEKRIPPLVFGWPANLLEAFLEGLVDGDGSRDEARMSVWTTSEGLVGDVLLLAARLRRRAGSCVKQTSTLPLTQVYLPEREHKLLTSVPLPDVLLAELRGRAGLSQTDAARRLGYKHASDLNNIERRSGRDAVRLSTLRRLHEVYEPLVEEGAADELKRLTDGDLSWDTVVAVHDTGFSEPIYDLEVRPNGRHIENFLAGRGGVFVSNTAGFVDAGWDGHLTLELSNVANLPIAIYPGMKIGQISFIRMTTEADDPYGSTSKGSKYQGQRGPTPSRYYLNFDEG